MFSFPFLLHSRFMVKTQRKADLLLVLLCYQLLHRTVGCALALLHRLFLTNEHLVWDRMKKVPLYSPLECPFSRLFRKNVQPTPNLDFYSCTSF